MEQASLARRQDHGLRPRVARLLHSRRASWWFRLVARAGAGLFVGFVGFSFIVYFRPEYGVPFPGLSRTPIEVVLLGSVLVGVVVAGYSYRTMQDPEPPKQRVPRRQWPLLATGEGIAVAIGVAWATFWLWFFPAAGILRIVYRFIVIPLPSIYWEIGSWCLVVSVPLVLATWAFVARRDQQLEVFETALPPELRLMVDLHRRAEAFRDRAQALEGAMDEATAISEQVQRGIDLERQQLAEVHEQYLRQARLNELTPEQATAVAELLGRQQARSARRALVSNVVIGFVFYVLGVVTPALISSDALRELLRQWFPLL